MQLHVGVGNALKDADAVGGGVGTRNDLMMRFGIDTL